MDDERQRAAQIGEQDEVFDRASEQIGTSAQEIRPDLATSAEEEDERTSDRGDRRRESMEATIADNAGHPQGVEQGNPDIGQEASPGLSEPG